MSFSTLNLIHPILKALTDQGYKDPTPVQQKAIPVILESNDVLATAQTGTGKTAAFVLPILQLLHQRKLSVRSGSVRALILSPTRELAIQTGQCIEDYGRYLDLKYACIVGGVSQAAQVNAVRNGVDIVVATPGRLMDLVRQRKLALSSIEIIVLDEADRMLDMGFIGDIKKIVACLPAKKQTLLFSATMPASITRLAQNLLKNPVRIDINPGVAVVERILQQVYFTEKQNKEMLLLHLLNAMKLDHVLVFTEMKHVADKLSRNLNRAGIRSGCIHGGKSQSQRQAALSNFIHKKTRVLVATDIAARGIDIDNLPCVINYQLPKNAESYVHRIGRTGRAGTEGMAISLCDWSEKANLREIQKLIKISIPVVGGHPFDASLMHQSATAQQSNSGSHTRTVPVRRKKAGRSFLQQA